MKKLNVGLIGAGFMGKAHSLAYAAMPMFFWPAPAIPHRAMLADVTEIRPRGGGAVRVRILDGRLEEGDRQPFHRRRRYRHPE